MISLFSLLSNNAAADHLSYLPHHISETQPLAVETKMSPDIPPETSPRSEESADKSGDSGISGDHANSDDRLDSPSRHNVRKFNNYLQRL